MQNKRQVVQKYMDTVEILMAKGGGGCFLICLCRKVLNIPLGMNGNDAVGILSSV